MSSSASSSSWFTEIPVDSAPTPSSSADDAFDKDLESKIMKIADKSCFAQYFVDKVASTSLTSSSSAKNQSHQQQQKKARRTSSPLSSQQRRPSSASSSSPVSPSPTVPSSSVIKVHVLDNGGVDEHKQTNQNGTDNKNDNDHPLFNTNNDDDVCSRSSSVSSSVQNLSQPREKSLDGIISKSIKPSSSSSSDQQQRFKAKFFSQTVSSYFSKFSSTKSDSEDEGSKSTTSLAATIFQNIVPEDAYLRPIPVSTNPNNNNNNNNNNQNLLIRKLYEPQIQTLEISNLPGFVVFADVVLLEPGVGNSNNDDHGVASSNNNNCRTAGSGGRFLLLSSHPLFSDEEEVRETENGKQETQNEQGISDNDKKNNKSSSMIMRFASQPTGWKIVYFAPKNAQVRLRIVVLKKTSDLIKNKMVDVCAFGSNEKAPSGATRCCVDNDSSSAPSKWIVTCGGGGIGNFRDTVSVSSSSGSVTPPAAPALPLNFLRPVGIITSASDDDDTKITITGFEVGINSSQTTALSNILFPTAASTSSSKSSSSNTKIFDQNLFAWVVAIRAVDDENEEQQKTKINIVSNLSSMLFHHDPAYNLSWSLRIFGDANGEEDPQKIIYESVTISTGQAPSSSSQVLSAKMKWNSWLMQYCSSSSASLTSPTSLPTMATSSLSSSSSSPTNQNPTTTNSELKGVPPEFWHAQRRLNSMNVVKKGFTDLILGQ